MSALAVAGEIWGSKYEPMVIPFLSKLKSWAMADQSPRPCGGAHASRSGPMIVPEGKRTTRKPIEDSTAKRFDPIGHERHHLVKGPSHHAGKPGAIRMLNICAFAVARNTVPSLVGYCPFPKV